MIREVTSRYDAQEVEKNVMEFWKSVDAYALTRSHRSQGDMFYFLDGPPYTTGRIHLGTAWNKTIKDAMLRYKSMRGFRVLDRAGWDMHGLPIEVKVEGSLGFRTKKEIEKYGIDKFIAECKRFALESKDQMTLQFKRLGAWLDWADPYMTLADEYMEAEWWTLKRAYDRGLLERGKRVVNWCPRCETAIADSEVEYWEERHPSIYVKFPLVGEDARIVIWTTTPWTIPSNQAIAVHPDFEYSKIKCKNETLIVASELVEHVLEKGGYEDYEKVGTIRGKDLVGIKYEHPLRDMVPYQQKLDHSIYAADFVTLEVSPEVENTGCVHIAPGHGLEDFLLGKEHQLPIFCPVGPDGFFTTDAGVYANKYVFDANQQVIKDLDERNALLAEGEIIHRYGHCWRCKTPIIYLATEQWFIKISELKDRMLTEISRIVWYPEWAGSARFMDWISSARDWCISRQRYWGTPLPIWMCECGSIEVIGTIKELKERANVSYVELHRPHIDAITLRCTCGKTMYRVEDVFDVWFDSAVASWANLGFPNDTEKFKKWWPADFITEGHDQTRGWFYSQLGSSMVAFEKAPYKSVLMHGFTLDDEGRKMSKSLGNVVAPEEVIEKYGADALRFYVLSANAPWEDLGFNWEEAQNVHRMLNILWNVYRFPLPYMKLDNFDPYATSFDSIKGHLRPEDKWILSRMHSLIKKVDHMMADCKLHSATRLLQKFILEDVSRWYVQLIRPRTWTEADDPNKLAAYWVLYDVISQITKLMAPFTPFITEEIYQNLVRGMDPKALLTVHMCDWPSPNEELIDVKLEANMDVARDIVEASHRARQKAKRKLRWPVKQIIISSYNEEVVNSVKNLKNVIMEQANTKEINLLNVGEEFNEISLKVIPDLSIIGPRFKGKAKEIINALNNVDGRRLKKDIEKGYQLKLPDKTVKITQDMIHFEEMVPEHIYAADFSLGKVYVDVSLTEGVRAEGCARDIVRRIQNMRKELDLDVEAEIDVFVQVGDGQLVDLIDAWRDFISEEIRAKKLELGTDVQVRGDLVREWTVENVEMRFGITR
ncbi:MAG TPA: isoleucine--tRNA ligase [Methanocellales archaeon]|nr:isoleucine--tRNA ligase [Methanocellales archaeon]